MVKHITISLTTLLILAVLSLGGAALWLSQDVRSLNWARPAITYALNSKNAPYVISIADVKIDWRKISRLGLLRVEHVTIAGRDGAVFLALPKVYVSLDPLGFLPHRHNLHTIYLRKPKLLVSRDKEHALRLGLEGSEDSMKLSTLLAFFASPEEAVVVKKGKAKPFAVPFRRLVVENAKLTLTDEATGTALVSPAATFWFGRYGGAYEAALKLPFTYDKVDGHVEASLLNASVGRSHTVNAVLDKVPSQIACVIGACPDGVEMQGLLNGRVSLTLDAHDRMYEAMADLTTPKAVVGAPTYFPEKLQVKDGHLAMTMGDSGNHITLSTLKMELPDTTVNFTGEAKKAEAGWSVNGQGKASRLKIEKLYKYWPMTLAPQTREWVNQNLSVGYGDNATIDVALTPQDFSSPTIADSALKATIDARNLTVKYLPDFPQVQGVDGKVLFTGTTLRIDGNTGTAMRGTALSKASLWCPNLNHPNTPMEVELELSAPAADAATLLAIKQFTFDDALKLNPEKLSGTVDSTMKLGFNGFSEETAANEVNLDKVTYDINANLKDVAQKNLAGGVDLAAINGNVSANMEGMQFEGNVAHAAGAKLVVSGKQKTGGDVSIQLAGNIDRRQFASLGLPETDWLKSGILGVDATVIAKKAGINVTAGRFDLTGMAMEVPELSWSKKLGVKGSVTLKPEGKNYRIRAQADDLNIAEGTLELDDTMALRALHLPRVTTDVNDFALDYATRADGFNVTLRGKRLDVSKAYASTESGLLANFPPINLTLDIGELVLVPILPLNDLKGELRCGVRCHSANITAKAKKAQLQATIGTVEGKRQLLLTATDAGDLLRALDITNRVYGGKLELKGTYNDSLTPGPFDGRVIIGKFNLRNSEILGRILSIGSLTGMANVLTGSGIAFDKLSADMHALAGVVNIKKGRANGAALGITVSGKVDTTNSTLKLKGVVVPAYLLNSILGNIPILGQLMGGAGEGLIAFNYSVKGPYGDPDVFVNPLSALTPGFLRGIWGGGSDDTVDGKTPPKEPQKKYPSQ